MRHLLVTTLAALAVAGCGGGSSSGPDPITFTPAPPAQGQGLVASYAPPINVGPYPNDIYFAGSTDGTLQVPVTAVTPLRTAVNTLDGFSTVATITAPFNGPIDPASLIPLNVVTGIIGTETVFVLNTTTGLPLVPGSQYDVRISASAGTNSSVLEFVPLVPLDAKSTYAFFLTDGIQGPTGQAAAADTVFQLIRDAHLAGASTGNPDLDALKDLAIGPLIDAAVNLLGIPGANLISAWSVSTQSISDVMDTIEASATAQVNVLTPTGLTTAQLAPGLPGIADVYVGFMEIPYYMDKADPQGSFWIGAGGTVLTRFNTTPVPRETLRIPVIASLPNAMSGQTQPGNGWPVAIFQHGVTDRRLSLLALADSFAQAGFGMVAIDLPLHGITDPTNPLYQGPGSAFGDNERNFGLDNFDVGGQPSPDGIIDNGVQIFNIQNPLNARDYVRQATSDLIHLTRTIPTMDFDGDAAPDLDGNRIHFVGVSLGSIFSGVFLGLNSEVTTATLSSPAGPWTSILTDPEAITFGEPLRAGLAAAGFFPGTPDFDNYVRDLQTVLDPGDPVNYATAASANHPLHILEIVGDTRVPNTPTTNLANLWGAIDVSATVVNPMGVRGIVRFNPAGHTSLLSPADNPDATVEMQTQTVTFAATDGTTILVTNGDVVE